MDVMLISRITNRIIASLTIISLALLIAFAASCNREQKEPQTKISKSDFPSQKDNELPSYDSTEFSYRGAVSEKVYLHQSDVDYIAEKLSESRKTESWWMGIISGTLLLLVGAQLAFNRNSSAAISAINNSQGKTCQKVEDMEKVTDRHEEIIQSILTKRK